MHRSRKRTGLAEDIFAATSRSPWWMGLVMAVVTFALFHWVSGLELRAVPGRATGGQVAVGEMAKTVGSVLQWIIPPIFLIGAAVVYRRERTAYGTAEKADPVIGSEQGGEAASEGPYRTASVRPRIPDAHPDSWSMEVLRKLEWKQLEHLSAAYYRHLGFRVEAFQCGADGGADGGVNAKIYRADGARPVAILQCKAWGSRSVGVKTVRELVRIMAHNAVDAGVLLITGEFTDGATEFAKSHRIALGSGERFLKKLTSLPPDIQRDLLDVACSGAWTTPSCPSCGTKMVERGGDSKRFWGCATFPRCRQTFLMRGVA
jgi:hypothetical protein